MPVAQYVGGVEHAILHLLYSRFFTKVLHDMGMVDFIEPFAALLNQGSVINQGKAMSKSLGNGVDLGAELASYGVDAVRLTMLFAGPPEDDIDWADMSPGTHGEVPVAGWCAWCATEPAGLTVSCAEPLARAVAHIVDDSTRLAESFRFNVAISRLHELTKALGQAVRRASRPARAWKHWRFCWLRMRPSPPRSAGRCWVTTWLAATACMPRAGRRLTRRC